MSECENEPISISSRFVEKVFTIWVNSKCVHTALDKTLSSYAHLVTFSNVNKTLIESKKIENEIIFVIISNDEDILFQLHQLEQIDSIFILYSNN